MSRYNSTETAEFVKWIHDLVTCGGYSLLRCKDYEQEEQCEDKLLGYYDRKGIYIIPDRVFTLAESFLKEKNISVKELEMKLLISGYIRNEDDGVKFRYLRQKRIGKTKKRYLTFLPTVLFSKEELTQMKI